MTERIENTGFDEWRAAIVADEGYYLACAEGHASLPPRRVCPECGSSDLQEEDLPATGEIETFTVVHTAAPSFVDDVPYVTAVADFGPVRLTGVVVDAEPEAVEIGQRVEAAVGATETTGETVLVFRPA